jgi:hypothetical protein
MTATPEDYQAWFNGLDDDARHMAQAAGLDLPPDDHRIMTANRIGVEDHDGLPKFRRNGAVRVCDPLTERHTSDDEAEDAPPDELRADLAAGMRRVFLWVISDNDEPSQFFKNPMRVVRRFAIVCRAINIGSFSEYPLSKIAGLCGCTRANLSKISCDFRDSMGSKYLRGPGARESSRDIFRQSAIEAHERRRQAKPDASECL